MAKTPHAVCTFPQKFLPRMSPWTSGLLVPKHRRCQPPVILNEERIKQSVIFDGFEVSWIFQAPHHLVFVTKVSVVLDDPGVEHVLDVMLAQVLAAQDPEYFCERVVLPEISDGRDRVDLISELVDSVNKLFLINTLFLQKPLP